MTTLNELLLLAVELAYSRNDYIKKVSDQDSAISEHVIKLLLWGNKSTDWSKTLYDIAYNISTMSTKFSITSKQLKNLMNRKLSNAKEIDKYIILATKKYSASLKQPKYLSAATDYFKRVDKFFDEYCKLIIVGDYGKEDIDRIAKILYK